MEFLGICRNLICILLTYKIQNGREKSSSTYIIRKVYTSIIHVSLVDRGNKVGLYKGDFERLTYSNTEVI